MNGRENESPDSGPDEAGDVEEQADGSTGEMSASRESDTTPEEGARTGWIDFEREARRKLEH